MQGCLLNPCKNVSLLRSIYIFFYLSVGIISVFFFIRKTTHKAVLYELLLDIKLKQVYLDFKAIQIKINIHILSPNSAFHVNLVLTYLCLRCFKGDRKRWTYVFVHTVTKVKLMGHLEGKCHTLYDTSKMFFLHQYL